MSPALPDAASRAELERLNTRAQTALRAGDPEAAAALLEQAIALDPGQPPLWLNLAAARRNAGRIDAALEAVQGALRVEPRNFWALLMNASLLERAGRLREAGPAYGDALRLQPTDAPLDPATRRAVDHAREVNRRYAEDLEAHLLHKLEADPAGSRGQAGKFVAHIIGRRRIYRQEPSGYYFPGLPTIEFWDRDEFSWLNALESMTAQIQSELSGVLEDDPDELSPYLQHPDTAPLDQWEELNKSRRWSAYHLLDLGERVQSHCLRCPRTVEALQAMPQPRMARRSPAAMFSVLEPRTRIPPHTGIANTRLVMHLPLIVPPRCAFRVGNETREWRVGEAWVFDDTIEHEAWNDSDGQRVLLLADVWNPRLTPEERRMITEVVAAMDEFNGAPTTSRI